MNQFDFLMESGKTPKNPPGYLFSSITDENWQEPPMGYKNASERKSEEDRKREKTEDKQRFQENEKTLRKAEEIPKKQEQNRIRNFWDSLSPEERKQSEEEALDQADRTQVDLIQKGGIVARSVRRNLFDNYALNRREKKVSQ
jgi:hypothetical protein